MGALLTAAGLSKSYRGELVLHPADLCLREGVGVGLSGPNGSGKSTLLNLLAQVLAPDSGDILWDGVSVLGNRDFLRGTLGYVPQEDDLLEDLTVGRQLRLWMGLCGRSGPLDPEITGLLGLAELMGRRIGRLSGGMRRRVSIAMALLQRPRCLLLDEAFSGLDETYRDRLTGWLRDFLSGGGCLPWCSHNPGELALLRPQRLRMENGRLTPLSPPTEG